MYMLKHALGADLYTVRDDGEEDSEAAQGPAGDSNIALLPLVLAQGPDTRSTASGSVLAGGTYACADKVSVLPWCAETG